MNIPRRYIGKFVELQWADPRYYRSDIKDSPKGRPALATWVERGVLLDITDNVVRIEHSLAMTEGDADEHSFTAVHEALVERVTVYEPTPEVPS